MRKLLVVLTLALAIASVSGAGPSQRPRVHHLLFEVKNLDASIPFYRDRLGLQVKSRAKDFAVLQADNVGVYLWQQEWGWEARHAGERVGLGLYPHLETPDVTAKIADLRASGVKVVQEPKSYDWGVEAFVSDPDGYVWALVHMR